MNFYAIGFVAVLGAVGLGVDYHQQSMQAGVPLGTLGPGDYVNTISARIDGMKAEKMAAAAEEARRAAWREGPRPFLPDAPEGWVRRGFDEGDNGAILPAHKLKQALGMHPGGNYLAAARMKPGETLEGSTSSGIAGLMGQRSAADIVKEVATRSWVYERGGETVFIEVKSAMPPKLNSLAGNIAATVSATAGSRIGGRNAGYAVIGGVGYTEALNSDGSHPNHYRILEGTMGFGQEIRIRVHANASTASTREILQAIDYDGMNAMLKTPMATVGNAITPPPGKSEARLAEEMVDLRGEFKGLLAREAQYRIQNLDAGALMINTLAQGYGAGVDGVVDMTGGKAVNMETLIYAGYRKGLRDLMDGRDARQALNEVGSAFGTAVAQSEAGQAGQGAAPAAPAPKMSAALAAELGVLDEAAAPADAPAGAAAVATPGAAEQAAAPAPQGGGFMGKIAGLFGGGNAKNSGNAGGGGTPGKKAEIRKLGGGGTRLASGGGCGGGTFCQVKD